MSIRFLQVVLAKYFFAISLSALLMFPLVVPAFYGQRAYAASKPHTATWVDRGDIVYNDTGEDFTPVPHGESSGVVYGSGGNNMDFYGNLCQIPHGDTFQDKLVVENFYSSTPIVGLNTYQLMGDARDGYFCQRTTITKPNVTMTNSYYDVAGSLTAAWLKTGYPSSGDPTKGSYDFELLYDGTKFVDTSEPGDPITFKGPTGCTDASGTYYDSITVSNGINDPGSIIAYLEVKKKDKCTFTSQNNITLTNHYDDYAGINKPTYSWISNTEIETSDGSIYLMIDGADGRGTNAGHSFVVLTLINGLDAIATPLCNDITIGDANFDYDLALVAIHSECNGDGTHTRTNVLMSEVLKKIAVPGGSQGGTNTNQCPLDGGNGLSWILCPIYNLGAGVAGYLNNAALNYLYVDTSSIFSSQFQAAYNNFRNIGIALIIIAGLFMVATQAAGLEIFSAHTIRKALPRIVIAAIGMALAWPLLQFGVTFFNDIGTWIGGLILTAANVGSGPPLNILQSAGSGLLTVVFLGVGVAGAIFFLGWGLLGVLGAVILSLLIALLVLIIRQLVIIVCILLAPLAIAASVLPGTEKLWKFWKDTLLTTLFMFPIVMAFLSAGAALASIAGTAADQAPASSSGALSVMAILAYFAPYFMIPFAFRLAGGIMGNLTGGVSHLFNGGFAALRNWRNRQVQQLHQDRMDSRTGFSNTRLGGLYHRAFTRGGFNLGGAAEDRYQASRRKHLGQLTAKAVQDGNDIAGDDIMNRIASRDGVTRESALRDYATQYTAQRGGRVAPGEADRMARQAVGASEHNFGRIGSHANILASWKALAASNTGYAGSDQGLADLANDARRMIRHGYTSEADAVGHIKSLQTRLDQQGTWTGWFNLTRASHDLTAGDQLIADFREHTIEGNQLGRLAGGHAYAVGALAEPVADRAIHAGEELRNAINTGAANINDVYRRYMERMADVLAINDQSAGASPEVRREIGSLMSRPIFTPDVDYDPDTHQAMAFHIPADPRRARLTISQSAEGNRSDPVVQELRREWGANRPNRQPPLPPGVGAAPPPGGAVPGAGVPPMGPPGTP